MGGGDADVSALALVETKRRILSTVNISKVFLTFFIPYGDWYSLYLWYKHSVIHTQNSPQKHLPNPWAAKSLDKTNIRYII